MTWNKNMDDAPRDGTERAKTYSDFMRAMLLAKEIAPDLYQPVIHAELFARIRKYLPQPPEVEG